MSWRTGLTQPDPLQPVNACCHGRLLTGCNSRSLQGMGRKAAPQGSGVKFVVVRRALDEPEKVMSLATAALVTVAQSFRAR